ncbi:MAG: M2 family metallopeptidase [Verrucomicrobia bacterium]|nr:M2 family metallopeptidase [Verrucomicrobiota bacterium]MBU6446293.1 M2 family metallopeptidase [Verrucomicrobiota bacterium]MDE3048044.1 M2 family metallopeptidase [Verrucomicrobiota bacterium]
MTFEEFLKDFVPQVARKTTQLNKAYWILETTGSSDAADLKAELDTELRFLFHDAKVYQQLLAWAKEPHEALAKRQLDVLIRAFKQNQVPKNLLEEMSQKEALLGQSYANFRPEMDGRKWSENEIREILKNENDPKKRQQAWEASKQIGDRLAPQILALVRLRNQAAQTLGYRDYFQMQLDLQEVDAKWLLKTLDDLAQKSDAAYTQVLKKIEAEQAKRFHTQELGPWAWSDPFGQEDPLDARELDELTQDVDIPRVSESFYQKMGIDVKPILAKSDMFERPGKNQHAFCMHLDRCGDVRTLNNVTPSIRWLETVLHELGHAIYELGLNQQLPWLLREPPHMIPTEAMALIAGRQAYRSSALAELIGPQKEALRKKADESLRRRQLIFSRWVLVMTAFESELYRDPSQDLNRLWWQLVAKYQKITPPKNREKKCDWAAKYHIGLAPVYYFSYLLGEMFASAIQEALVKETGSTSLATPQAGRFLNQKLFDPGNRMPWNELVRHVTGALLTPDAWVKEFAT